MPILDGFNSTFDFERGLNNIYGQGGVGDPLIALGTGLLSRRNVGEGLAQGFQNIQANQLLQRQRGMDALRQKQIEASIAKANQPDYGFATVGNQLVSYDKSNPSLGVNALPNQPKPAQGHWAGQNEMPAGYDASKMPPIWINPTGEPEIKGSAPQKTNTIEDDISSRQRAIVSRNLDPNDPRNQQYIMTGRYPREEQQPLTAGDKKAILEADEMVLSNNSAISALKKAKEASPKAWGYRGAGTAASILAPFNQGAQDTVDLDNIVVGQALANLKTIFGGNPTEGERAIMLQLQGSSALPDAERQRIYDRGIALAQKRLEFNQKQAEGLRSGTYYNPRNQSANTPAKTPTWSVVP